MTFSPFFFFTPFEGVHQLEVQLSSVNLMGTLKSKKRKEKDFFPVLICKYFEEQGRLCPRDNI